MLHQLRRHPFPVRAYFQHSLVLTYAFPAELLVPMLPPSLTLDTYKDFGFLAIALVQTRQLRPSIFPSILGQDFFLSGYRLFTKFREPSGISLRGLRILRSDTDRKMMSFLGNLFTHYSYRFANVKLVERSQQLEVAIQTPNQEADLELVADLSSKPAPLPEGSPFDSLEDAKHFAGPLPYTFDYEKETHSLIAVKGIRTVWNPQPIHVQVRKNTFLQREPFSRTPAILANAFHLTDVPYRWTSGTVYPLSRTAS